MSITPPHRNRIQLQRKKGWRLPPGAISVARPSRWGNPFLIRSCIDAGFADDVAEAREVCVQAFHDWLMLGDQCEFWNESTREQWEFMCANIHRLEGKTLACYCPLDVPCHADSLAHFAHPMSVVRVQNAR